jgi:1,4-alpha-glucan branching enzyme
VSSDAPVRGELSIVLHTHMPYVEGFGTWPFGEEWLWEAMAGCYLPLLHLLRSGAPLTISMTPVLADQLDADIAERFEAFLRGVRRRTHARDAAALRGDGEVALAAEIERAAGDYERALEHFGEIGGDLLGALAPFIAWTSSATHAVLPLLATDAGVRLQVQSGLRTHRARISERWRGGFWLPECAHAAWLHETLADAGVHASCVELTDRLGLGSIEHLTPIATESGLTLVPVDRATIDLVWGASGYPSRPAYRDSHRRTTHWHHPWANSGQPYDHAAALAGTRDDARDFIARARARLLAAQQALPDGGLLVCALDTELLGHWWYEGVAWLAAVVQEAEQQGVVLSHLDDALTRHPGRPAPAGALDGVCSWGSDRTLGTWDGAAVADVAWTTRRAELAAVAAGPRLDRAAVRHLLALQSSDWAFLVSRELAPSYGRERLQLHLEGLSAGLRQDAVSEEPLRELARHADVAALLAP